MVAMIWGTLQLPLLGRSSAGKSFTFVEITLVAH
jgi:hypothetical protein